MPQPGTIDINDTLRAWTDIVIEKWHARITELKVYRTGDLYNSFKQQLFVDAGNNINRIEFAFLFYGIFVNAMEKREWYDKLYYAQLMRLREIITEKYSDQIAVKIAFAMQPSKF